MKIKDFIPFLGQVVYVEDYIKHLWDEEKGPRWYHYTLVGIDLKEEEIRVDSIFKDQWISPYWSDGEQRVITKEQLDEKRRNRKAENRI